MVTSTKSFLNTVTSGDAMELLRKLEPGSIDFAFISPPGEMSNPLAFFGPLKRVMKTSGVVWYVTSDLYDTEFGIGKPWLRVQVLRGMGWKLVADCIVEQDRVLRDKFRRPPNNFDYAFLLALGPEYFYTGELDRSVWRFKVDPKIPGYGYVQTPVKLVQMLIAVSCPWKGIVLDPMLGTGTTAIAAIREKRDWIGFDSDHKACEIARKRIEEEQDA